MRVQCNSVTVDKDAKVVTLGCLDIEQVLNLEEIDLDTSFSVRELQFEFRVDNKPELTYLVKMCLSNSRARSYEKASIESLAQSLLGKTIFINSAFLKKAA